ncbi:MAG: FAD-dependent oxidoreductase [Bradymonadia bacterium]
MIQDARELSEGALVEADLCIIGGGAAGMSIARQFLDQSALKVVLLESGGLKKDPKSHALNQGEVVGRNYFKLEDSRSRYFGGSTNCWAGLCLPLQAVDFEKRDYLPHSGWPITRADLDPFYARAQGLLDLGRYEYRSKPWGAGKRLPLDLSKGPLESAIFQMSRPTRMGTAWRDLFKTSESVRVLLHANVTRLGLAAGGGALEELDVKVIDGPGFKVKARHYVLATGGLENPRIMLASKDVNPKGVGNDNDLVGRFFMEHPHTDGEGVLVASPHLRDWGFYKVHRARGARIWGMFQAPDALIKKEKMLNFSMVLFPYKPRGKKPAHPLTEAVAQAVAETDTLLDEPPPAPPKDGPLLLTLGTPSEQAPNPDSRVTLSDEKDPLGMPRIALDWRMSDIDKRSIKRAHELMALTVARAGLGRMKVTLDDDEKSWPKQMHGGWHHMGTTRMASDSKSGVVDQHCTVHGVENLSIAGSSVFTTGGAANPTLTIVALALKLADHLKGKLS